MCTVHFTYRLNIDGIIVMKEASGIVVNKERLAAPVFCGGKALKKTSP